MKIGPLNDGVLGHYRVMKTRWGLAIVRGDSMRPTLAPGDRLLVRHGRLPKVGQVGIVELPDGTIAIKRLVLLDDEGWWFSRDNPNDGVDSWTLGRPSGEADVKAVAVMRLWPKPTKL